MIFLKPEYLTMMLIPTLILFYFIISNKSALDTYFDKKVLEKLRFDNDALGKIGRNMMLFVALIMMIVALARPVLEKGKVQIKTKSIDMMVALDISKSMLAADFYPSRLAFAKKKFVELVESFKEANIGVVAFASEGFLVSPMTQDSTTLKYLVNNLSLDSMSLTGTNMMIPIMKGKEFLEKSKDKIIIIMTDGGDKQEFIEEIERAKAYKESIYIYAIATEQGAPIKIDGESLKDKDGNIVVSSLNGEIKKLAFETGGAYIEASYEDNSIALMVEDIKKKFKMHAMNEKSIREYKELFYYPLSLAVLFLLFAFHSLPRRGGSTIMIGFIVLTLHQPMEAKIFNFMEINKADKAYHDKEYDEAEKYYQEVIKSNKSPESIYALANTQYKMGKYKEALKNYDNVTALSTEMKYKKDFNKGNSYFQLKEYEKAIQEYEKAKKQKSGEDVEYNLALAKKKLKEKKEQEKKNKNTKKNTKKKGEKKKNNDKKGGGGDSDEKNNQQKKKKDEKKNEKSEKKQGAENNEMKKKPIISKKEEKIWEKQLERMRPKTMPLKLNIKNVEREKDEKPW